MRFLKREEAAPYLRRALNAAKKSPCMHIKEGVIAINQSGDIIADGYRILQSGSGLKLCRGECVMNGNRWNCPAKHAIYSIMTKLIANVINLRGIVLCRIVVNEGTFCIPTKVDCCERCERMVVQNEMGMLLWNSSHENKGCAIFSSSELVEGVNFGILKKSFAIDDCPYAEEF